MKAVLHLLVLIAAMMCACIPTTAQLVVGSYERKQPFIFCGDTPQSETFDAPFSMANIGATDVILDSAIATGDTNDFASNWDKTGSYLNPIQWEFTNGKSMPAHSFSLSGFAYRPRTQGDKQLHVYIYYHLGDSARLTQAFMLFHTAQAPPGLSFIAMTMDTVWFIGSKNAQGTYDRSVMRDTVFRYHSTSPNGQVKSSNDGMNRIDLSSCSGASNVSVQIQQQQPEDSFAILRPTLPTTIASGDSTLVQYVYIPRSAMPEIRTATARFYGDDGQEVVLKLTVRVLAPLSVNDQNNLTPTAQFDVTPSIVTDRTTLRYTLMQSSPIHVGIFDAIGNEVAVLYDGPAPEGEYSMPVDVSGFARGTYFVRIGSGSEVLTRHLVVY